MRIKCFLSSPWIAAYLERLERQRVASSVARAPRPCAGSEATLPVAEGAAALERTGEAERATEDEAAHAVSSRSNCTVTRTRFLSLSETERGAKLDELYRHNLQTLFNAVIAILPSAFADVPWVGVEAKAKERAIDQLRRQVAGHGNGEENGRPTR